MSDEVVDNSYDEVLKQILKSNKLTRLVISILVGSNTLLLTAVVFFGHEWVNHVNQHIETSVSGYERITRLEENQKSMGDNQRELLVEVRSIRALAEALAVRNIK